MTRSVRALLVSEGSLGTAVMGHAQVESALRTGLGDVVGVDARHLGLSPLGRPGRLLVRHAPLLGRADLDLQTVRWHVVQSVRTATAVSRALRRYGEPDVVHVDGHTIAFLLGRLMSRLPCFLSVDATVADWEAMGVWRRRRPWSAAMLAPSLVLERRALAAAAGVLAWSAWAARAVNRASPGARVMQHHPGIDLVTFTPATRRAPGKPRMLFVGGRFGQKGGHDLLDALGPMLDRDLELDLVTPATVAPRPGVRLHRLGPGDPRLVELHRQADIFCLPSYGEGLPFALLEAMACGVAVVASSVGAMPEGVGDGEAGVVVAPGDIAGLRAAIQELVGDDERRHSLGAAGRARCERLYDCRRQARALAELMRQAL